LAVTDDGIFLTKSTEVGVLGMLQKINKFLG